MPINPLPHPIARPLSGLYGMDTPPSDNARASNPPVSGNPAASPSRSHQYGSAAFLQQTPSAQALLLKNAKSSAKKDPTEFFRRFDADALRLSQESRTKLAWWAVKRSPLNLAQNIQKFAIFDESIRFELAHRVAKKKPEALAWHIQNFAISSDNAKFELANIVGEKDSKTLVDHIQDFAISDERLRIELAHRIAENKPDTVAWYIRDFAISKDKDKFELAKIVAEKNSNVLIDQIRDFSISDERLRIELAHKVAKKEPEMLAWHIQDFAIADERARTELAQIIGRKYLPPFRISENDYLKQFEISNPSARANLYASFYLGLIAKGTMSATEEAWRNQFFPRDPESLPLAQVAAQFPPHPVIAGLLTTAEQHPDPYIRETLSTWAQLVALRFAADPLSAAAWQELKAPLEAIQKLRAPATRYALALLLAQHCLPPEAGDVNGFFAFGQRFTKPHTHLYSALLFPLFQSATNDPALERLVTLLHRPDFKEAKRQKVMVNALLALVQADRLPDALKRALLQAALPDDSDMEAAHSLADTASAMQWLVSLAQNDPELGDSVLQRLKSIRNPDDFNEEGNEVLKDLFPNLSNAQDVAAQFDCYREHARDPTAVLSYAAKMRNGLAGHEKASVLAAIGQFVNAALLAPEPERAFRELRYNYSAKSPHLHLLAHQAQAAFAKWRQPCVYQPSAAFLAQTSGGTKQTDIAAYLKQRIVMDKHVPPGTYPLLEEVLAGHRMLASALQESEPQAASATGVETDLLRLLEEGTPMEQKAELITQLLESLPQDQVQFHRDLTDLKTLLTPSGRQDHKQFTVIDTDAAEDLFLCGTEVLGSCQNIQGDPDLNKALMGYVLDGKYRMLAIKSADERLMGRRMLRLLWDEHTQRPVLHLERLYHNPGVPEKYKQALVELAQQKAEQMECDLVSHDALLPSGGIYRTPLIAYPTPWPFEYVDAEGLGVQAGEKKYQLSRARIVAFTAIDCIDAAV